MDVVHALPSMEDVFSENLQDNGSFMGPFLFLLLQANTSCELCLASLTRGTFGTSMVLMGRVPRLKGGYC